MSDNLRRSERTQRAIAVELRVELPVWPESAISSAILTFSTTKSAMRRQEI
jgi:hypothetical protein